MELKQHIMIKDPSGNKFTQEVQYEWTPQFCKTCNLVGHNCITEPDVHKAQPPRKLWQPTGRRVQLGGGVARQAAHVVVNDPPPTSSTCVADAHKDGEWTTVSRRRQDKGKEKMVSESEFRFGNVDYVGVNGFAALRIGDDPGEPPDISI